MANWKKVSEASISSNFVCDNCKAKAKATMKNFQEMEWDEIVESQGWTVETEYELAMEFIIGFLKQSEAYRNFLAKKAEEEVIG